MPVRTLVFVLAALLVSGCERQTTKSAPPPPTPDPSPVGTPRQEEPDERDKTKAVAAGQTPRPDMYISRHPRLRPSTRVPVGQGIEVMAGGQRWPFWVEVDGTHVYWNTGDGKLRRVPKSGGGQPEQLFSKHSTTFVVGANEIYLTGGRLGRIPKSGGAQTIVDKREALGVVLWGDRLFYNLFKGRTLHSIGIDGKGHRVLHRARKNPADHATDGKHVFFVTYSRYGGVYRVPIQGGKARLLAGAQPKPVGIHIDSTHVYWSLEGDGTIRRMPKKGGRKETVVTGQDNHDTLVGDDKALYWNSWDRGPQGHTLRRLDKASGRVSTLMSNLAGPSGMALDDTHIYVANKGAWTILRGPR